jgi:hypothetical protein
MATIVMIEHVVQPALRVPYVAHELARRWVAAGHRVLLHCGFDPPPGDVAILHVDATVVPEAYRACTARFPRVVNAAAWDISKRRVSDCVIGRDDPWPGPVIVKTNANVGGRTEALLVQEQRRRGLPEDVRAGPLLSDYPIFPSRDAVPEAAWRDPGLVVEKFVGERDAQGFHLRVWTFFGSRERSSLCTSPEPVIKSQNVTGRVPVEVPPQMREARRRLGFDFGKFDYVRHEGRFYLLDANRTPSAPTGPSAAAFAASLDDMAGALPEFLGVTAAGA